MGGLSSRFGRLGGLWAVLSAFLLVSQPLLAQALPEGMAPAQEGEEAAWQPPNLADLPVDWWQQFQLDSPDVFRERANAFLADVAGRVQGLSGDDLLTARNQLAILRGQRDLLLVAMQEQQPEPVTPIPTRATYPIDDLLGLRAQWREVQSLTTVAELRREELVRQSALIEQRRDSLLRQYDASNPNTPARILLGLQRVSTQIELAVNRLQRDQLDKRLDEYGERVRALDEQFKYARAHIAGGASNWADEEQRAAEIHAESTALSEKEIALQGQLLDALSGDGGKPSLTLLRKQQLTRTSAEQALALIQESLHQALANWYRLHAGVLHPDFDIKQSLDQSRSQVKATEDQIEVWLSASQATAMSPPPTQGLNDVKNVELAHQAARDTLARIEEIRAAIDDLTLVQNILAADMVSSQTGLQSLSTRVGIAASRAWQSIETYLDYNLFHIGDAPVTPMGIVTMLLILVFGYAISWIIRHLLERLNRRQQFAQSSVVYSLGRVLHYIIILAAVFAALGSIGLNFSNFALIAGALSVGIGFGLQSIVNNFVSGLIILFEGSLRVGDFIQLDTGLRGAVKEINTRATVVRTNDSIDVVVPNSEFVSRQLTNWTLREPIARIRVDFGVAYGSDKERVREAACQATAKVDCILHNMPGYEPQVRLIGFGDSRLDFQVLFWVSKAGVRRPGRTRAAFLWELESILTEMGIEIPFPQRDLHLRGAFEQLAEPAKPGSE